MKMTQHFVLLLILTLSFSIKAADTNPPPPKIEAVPAPKLEAEKPEGKVDGSLTGNRPTDLGLIKTQKTIVDKTCRMVKGKLKCPRKFKRRKTIK